MVVIDLERALVLNSVSLSSTTTKGGDIDDVSSLMSKSYYSSFLFDGC